MKTEASDGLLAWYDEHRRDLPWRRTADPYAIWVSEIMLQQTQVATVLPYYGLWMDRFPDIVALAASDDDTVLSLWQGLGYYRRCRLLLAGARIVAANGWPKSAAEWRAVPGVGKYTAAAIASIALGERVGVLDGNVERVFARLTGCSASGGVLRREAWKWVDACVSSERPGDWNQAMMEIGATVCRPVAPQCGECPLAEGCFARAKGRQSDLPVKSKRVPTVRLERDAWVYVCGDLFGLEQAPAGEWWEGMWRFPTTSGVSRGLEAGRVREIDGLEKVTACAGIVRHTVTSHRIAMTVYVVPRSEPAPELSWFTIAELACLALPSPYRRALALAITQLGHGH
ncbi:MAG TPA: A/G-specific adenine glycosylase [Fimbriimonadaceae bacterium]|nr:A/G-specific adenine glycosylase [Fimbriimonadaceae bacterium]